MTTPERRGENELQASRPGSAPSIHETRAFPNPSIPKLCAKLTRLGRFALQYAFAPAGFPAFPALTHFSRPSSIDALTWDLFGSCRDSMMDQRHGRGAIQRNQELPSRLGTHAVAGTVRFVIQSSTSPPGWAATGLAPIILLREHSPGGMLCLPCPTPIASVSVQGVTR